MKILKGFRYKAQRHHAGKEVHQNNLNPERVSHYKCVYCLSQFITNTFDSKIFVKLFQSLI